MVRGAISTTLSKLGREAGRLVLVSPCIVCGDELPWRERVASCCAACWTRLPRIAGAKCERCAAVWEVSAIERFVCLECGAHPPDLEWSEAWGAYTGALERVLHAFKFERQDFFAGPLAGLITDTLVCRGDLEFDCITAVPMHSRKLRQRGYNQAELLARRVAKAVRIRYRGDLLLRRVEGQAQSTLARDERRANARRIFAARPSARGLSILLIDDIATTGETMKACARSLAGQGAARICGAVVARA